MPDRGGSFVDQGTADPELVGSLLSAVQQLRRAEAELARQNADLVATATALDAERRRYRRLFDRARLAYLTTDWSGRIIDANIAAAQMLQVEPQSLTGQPIASVVAPGDRARVQSWLVDALDYQNRVIRLCRGRDLVFDAELFMFRDEETVSWMLREVTSELQARQQIRDHNRKLELQVAEQAIEIDTVYDQLPIGVAIVRALPDHNVESLNRRGRELLGDAFPFDEQVRSALLGQVVHTVQLNVGERVLEVSAVPIRDHGGAIARAVLTFDDITERMRVERAHQDFIANSSHQLRTPIAAIGSAVAALKAGAAAVPKERDRFLGHLDAEVERLARIIEAMLVLSRAQRRHLDAPLTLIRLRPLLERLVADTRPVDGVELTLECASNVGVIAHQALLEEALANVLANAAEHTRSGTISVAARRQLDKVEIEIADTGPGMAPEIRQRAFERFFGSTPTRRSAGLGLAIAAAAVEASRGRIDLDSEPGVGTRVRMRLFGAPLLPPT
jgi:PAS domain S-box-containing protein